MTAYDNLNYNEFLDTIISNINTIREQEYELYGFVKKEFLVKDKPLSEYNSKQQLNQYQSNMRQYSYEQNKKKNIKQIETSIYNQQSVDIINDSNVFNLVKEKSEYIDWKKLDNVVKKEKIKSYLDLYNDKYYVDDQLINDLYELIDDNKLNYKKYIDYDKVNERITKMPVLVNHKTLEKTIIVFNETKKTSKTKKFFNN